MGNLAAISKCQLNKAFCIPKSWKYENHESRWTEIFVSRCEMSREAQSAISKPLDLLPLNTLPERTLVNKSLPDGEKWKQLKADFQWAEKSQISNYSTKER